MNRVDLVGRLTRDPEVRYTTGEKATAICNFSIAVDRKFKNAEGKYEADFISCRAFGKTAEFVEKYFHKGMRIGVCGRIQTGNYTNKDGQKVYTTDVIAEDIEFVESKNSSTGNSATPTSVDSGFVNIPDDAGDELPFN